MRPFLLLCHRWFGLSAALFLFIAGLTGAIIAWEYEIDAWINPDLYEARTPGTAQDPVTLAAAFERAEPRLRVMWLPLSMEPGQTLQVGVRPCVNP